MDTEADVPWPSAVEGRDEDEECKSWRLPAIQAHLLQLL
jgi:hypothetical protein